VVVHAAGAGFDAIVPAAVAGAAALVDKSCGTRELLAAIRGEQGLPRIMPRLQRRAAARLGGTDRAILAMRLADTPNRDIAATVGMSRAELAGRIAAIVAELQRPGETRRAVTVNTPFTSRQGPPVTRIGVPAGT
jgi:hypothetical protein